MAQGKTVLLYNIANVNYKEYMNREHIPRRDFLRGVVHTGISLATMAVLGGSQVSKEYAPQSLAEILSYEVLSSPQPSPIKKGGIGYNGVYLPFRDENTQEAVLNFAVESGATFLRVFFDCPAENSDYEPNVGKYQEDVLRKFSSFCARAADRGLSLIVALSDGYRMGACLDPNPVYGSKQVLSPYYQPNNNNDPWMPFYTDPYLVQAYENRTKLAAASVMSALGPYLDAKKMQLFFEPMNEPGIPKGDGGKELFNQWLSGISGMLKAEYGVSSISGVADPDMVDTSIINTLHYYPNIIHGSEKLTDLVNKPVNLPTFIEETGINDKFLNLLPMHDQQLFSFLSDIFLRTTKIDFARKTIQPLISPLLCLWHIDPGNDDHYTITESLPSSLALIRCLSTMYQKAAIPLKK